MKSIQDILNAFRERFGEHEVLCGLEEYPHAKCSCEYPEIIKWLLTTLTEFERETKKRIKLCAKEQSCSMCMESLSQLEKEKHPSK